MPTRLLHAFSLTHPGMDEGLALESRGVRHGLICEPEVVLWLRLEVNSDGPCFQPPTDPAIQDP